MNYTVCSTFPWLTFRENLLMGMHDVKRTASGYSGPIHFPHVSNIEVSFSLSTGLNLFTNQSDLHFRRNGESASRSHNTTDSNMDRKKSPSMAFCPKTMMSSAMRPSMY